MSAPIVETGTAVNRTTTGAVSSVPGHLIGFYVNSTTSGTVVVRDGGSGGTVLSGTITPAVGFHPFPASCAVSIHVTIGATLDATFFWVPA